MRRFIEFDRNNRRQRSTIANEKIDGTLRHLVLPCGPSGIRSVGAGKPEQLAKRDLRKNVAAIANDASEKSEEICLGLRHKVFVDTNVG